MFRWFGIGVGTLLLSATIQTASPLTVRTTPHNAFAPATLHAHIHLLPDARNRTLEVALVSEGGYVADSQRSLDGVDERANFDFEWRDVPPGHYTVIVDVTRNDDRHLVAKDPSITILGEHP